MSVMVGAPTRWRAVSTGFSGGRRLSILLVALPVLVTVIALVGPALAPHDPVQPVAYPNLPPGSDGSVLGTDAIGRDLLSRILYGVQASWFSALLVVTVGLLIGGIIGAVAGVVGGWLDAVFMRVTDLFLALPGTLVAIAIVATLGPGLSNTLVGVSVVWWPYYARIIRGEAKSIASRPHVEAARLAGTSGSRLMLRHILPGLIPTAVVTASLDIGNVVLLLAGLSFLGLGQSAPAAELGADTARALSQLLSAWWVPVLPGIAVLLLSLAANLGGDGIRSLVSTAR